MFHLSGSLLTSKERQMTTFCLIDLCIQQVAQKHFECRNQIKTLQPIYPKEVSKISA